MKAMKAQVTRVPLSGPGMDIDAGASRLQRIRFRPPPSRPEVTMVEDVDALASRLAEAGVLPQAGGAGG
jgi:hypothetical protein